MSSLKIILNNVITLRLQFITCRSRHKAPVAILLLLFALLSGCQSYRVFAPPAVHYFYLNPDKGLSTIGRAALVELNNDSSFPQVSGDVTEALFQALQKKQVFGLTVIHQDGSAWRSLQLDLDSTYTLDQLKAIHKALKCDAILIGTVTEFKPYPHLVIGLRLKLIDLRDGQLIWALEHIWDTADKTTERRIKRYFQSQMRSGDVTLRQQLVTISSLNFIKFVTFEVADTL